MSDSVSSEIRPAEGSAGNRHPSIETWIDYHARGVLAEESERLQQHLASCRRCLDLVLDLDGFARPAVAEPRSAAAASFEKAAVWRAVKGVIEPPGPAVPTPRWPAVAAVAAALVFATMGFSAWKQQHGARVAAESQIVELTRPQPNVTIQDLRPGARERSSSGVDATVDLSAEAATTLLLHTQDEVDFPRYEVRVFDASGAEVERIAGLAASDLGYFSLALRPGWLVAGSYDLRLFGLDGGSEREIETYPIRLH